MGRVRHRALDVLADVAALVFLLAAALNLGGWDRGSHIEEGPPAFGPIVSRYHEETAAEAAELAAWINQQTATGWHHDVGFARWERRPLIDGMAGAPMERHGYLASWQLSTLPLMIGSAAVLGAWYCVRVIGPRWRRRYRSPSACAACGYDLRATPTRCPECGAVPTAGRPGEPPARASSPANHYPA